jgi:hypothetical protein
MKTTSLKDFLKLGVVKRFQINPCKLIKKSQHGVGKESKQRPPDPLSDNYIYTNAPHLTDE